MPGIIVGIDGSDHSRRALSWAVREAAVRQLPLTVLSVNQAVAGYFSSTVPSPGDQQLTEQALKLAQQDTDNAIKQSGPGWRPPSVTVKAVTGQPAEVLLDAAEGAELLVVGSRGAGGFKRLMMGSVSTQVTHHAHCPVVVIPADRD